MSEINTEFWPEKLNRRSHMDNPFVNRRVILTWIFIKCAFADWINQAENRDEVWVFCDCLLNVPKTVEKLAH